MMEITFFASVKNGWGWENVKLKVTEDMVSVEEYDRGSDKWKKMTLYASNISNGTDWDKEPVKNKLKPVKGKQSPDYFISELAWFEEKYYKIIDAATKVFAKKGFFQAKISEIAREAEIADGTIYIYFENKDDILISLFEEHR